MRCMHALIWTMAILPGLGGCAPRGNSPAPGKTLAPRPELRVPYATVTPRINAALDDPAWAQAAVIPSLLPGLEGAKQPPRSTEVRLLWDEMNLYVRFVAEDEELYAPFDGRDAAHYKGDNVMVFIDARGDSRQYIEVAVTPTNHVLDAMFTLTAEPASDAQLRLNAPLREHELFMNTGYDIEGLKTATRRLPKGYIVDIAIPCDAILLRLPQKYLAPMTLRANLGRYDWVLLDEGEDPRELVDTMWAQILQGQPHTSPQGMGTLRLMPKK